MSESKVLLITGATGNQGGAVVDALLDSPSKANFTILGVTRDANSAGAKKLQAKSPLIKVIQGSFDDIPALFKSARDATNQPVWGVFSVQVAHGPGASPQREEADGKALIDESIKQGVKLFVQASVERSDDEKSWTNPTPVPHFASKHNIELYLRDTAESIAGNGKMDWTILRPVAFMDNFAPGFPTKIFFAALRDKLAGGKTLQFIAVHDIGVFAAKAFTDPQEYSGKAIGLAGDELTFPQLDAVFEKATGHGTGATFGILGRTFMWAVKEMGIMMHWLKTDGFDVDIPKLKRLHSKLMSFETWLSTKSGWAKK